LGELLEGKTKGLVTKEAWLGLLNGLLVGLTAGFAMYFYASVASHPSALPWEWWSFLP
jgi:magnesium transporter